MLISGTDPLSNILSQPKHRKDLEYDAASTLLKQVETNTVMV